MAFFIKVLKDYENELKKGSEDAKKLELMKIIVDDIMSLRFVKSEKLKRKLNFFIKVNFNYEKVAKEFNTSIHSLYVAVSRFDKKVSDEYEKMYMFIKKGMYDEAEQVYTKNKLNLFLDYNKVVIPNDYLGNLDVEDLGINLASCKKELALLKIYSYFMFKKNISKVDANKMIQVLYVYCSNDKGYEYERDLIDKFIHDDISLEDLLEVLQKVKGYRYST